MTDSIAKHYSEHHKVIEKEKTNENLEKRTGERCVDSS